MQVVQDVNLILTKNQIIMKAKLILEQLQYDFVEYIRRQQPDLPGEVISAFPKISRGENYQGLPYLILDYPRCFRNETVQPDQAGIFAIRTMFWWGKFFSITLHLSGCYKKWYAGSIIEKYSLLKKEKYFININQNEWEHHFQKSNYAKAAALSKNEFARKIRKNSHLKIAFKIPLADWDKSTVILFEHFKMLIEATGQLPSR